MSVRSSRKRQAHNAHKLRTSEGIFPSIRAAARHFGILEGTIQRRLAAGWSHNQAVGLSPPPLKKKREGKPVTCRGQRYDSVAAFARQFGKNQVRVRKRLDSGWTPEQAVDLNEPPPRFRNQVGGARTRHWKDVQVVNQTEYPSTAIGEYKLYVIKNKINKREYVGITISSLKARLRGHRANARKGYKGKLYNAMRHYGPQNFTIELIRKDARSFPQLQRQEIQEIEKRDSLKRGYNTSPGGSIGTPQSIKIGKLHFSSQSAAAEYFGIDIDVFNLRLSRLNWTPEEAAELMPRPKFARQKVTVRGVPFRSLKSAAKHFGVKYQLVHERFRKRG